MCLLWLKSPLRSRTSEEEESHVNLEPTPRKLAEDAVAAMGGTEKLQGIKTLSMSGGTGTRLRLGQMVQASDQENPGQLKNVVDSVDLANGRASLTLE